MHAMTGDAKYPLNPVPINASPVRAAELRSSGNRHKVQLTKDGPGEITWVSMYVGGPFGWVSCLGYAAVSSVPLISQTL
jgi:hypothetical protein